MRPKKNYIDLIIEEARIKLQIEQLLREKKAADDADQILRMIDRACKNIEYDDAR